MSVSGNLYSVPDTTRRRILDVHVFADEIRIFEDGVLVASHPAGRDAARSGLIRRIENPQQLLPASPLQFRAPRRSRRAGDHCAAALAWTSMRP